ncbi:MAG: hypothetical protein Q9O24_01050 [Gammaproteobacteria bacterium]|nr:hypothetical protein [Gammaproteobacteria bacterium]
MHVSIAYKALFLILLYNLPSIAHAKKIEIDVLFLEEKISIDTQDINSRLLLSKHYLNIGQINKAEKLIKQAVSLSPNNKLAKKLQININNIHQDREILSKYKITKKTPSNRIDSIFKKLHIEKNTEANQRLYETLERNQTAISDQSRFLISESYLKEKEYKKSKKSLAKVKNKESKSHQSLQGKICIAEKNNNCAIRIFQTLFINHKENKFGITLIDLYIKTKQINRAEKQMLRLKRLKIKESTLKKYESNITNLKKEQITAFQTAYKKNPSLANMKNLVSALANNQQHAQALIITKEYLKKNPKDQEAKLFFATRLSWLGKNEEALSILYKLDDGKNFKVTLLIAKILSWSGHYDEAKAHIEKTLKNTTNENIQLKHNKVLAFIYSWNGEKEKSIELFKQYLSKKPRDIDAQEELMILQGNIKPLIKKYTDLVVQFEDSEQHLYRLGNLHLAAGNTQSAIKNLEKYLNLKTQDLLVTRDVAILHIKLKNYYKGFGYLEYYAYKQGSTDAFLVLAKNYYWAGFPNAALDVIDEILVIDNNNTDAIELKANIQKQNPRFSSVRTTALPQKNKLNFNNKPVTQDTLTNTTNNEQIAFADRLSTAGFFNASLPYYQKYLLHKINDYPARSRYAFALQKSKKYLKAAGEYYLVVWRFPTPNLRFHYAYNLEMAGKVNEATQQYQKIINAERKKLKPEQVEWLTSWKTAWQQGDFKNYKKFYSSSLQVNKKWTEKKRTAFKKSKKIAIDIIDPYIENEHGNGYQLKFYQRYQSSQGSDNGYKILSINCKKKSCLIENEQWKKSKYQEKTIGNNILKNSKNRLFAIMQGQPLTSGNNSQQSQEKKIMPNTSHKDQKTDNKEYHLETKSVFHNDINGIHYENHALLLTKQRFGDFDLKVSSGSFFISDNNDSVKQQGQQFSASLQNSGFEIGFQRDHYNNFNTTNPYLKYKTQSNKKSYTFNLEKRNAVHRRFTECALRDNINMTRLEGTTYIGLDKGKNYWGSLEISDFSDNNKSLTHQFNFSFKQFSHEKFNTEISTSGWYQSNSRGSNCYYAPNFDDATYVDLTSTLSLPAKISLKAKIGVGYGLSSNSISDHYSLWFERKSNKSLHFKLGCNQSNSQRIGNTGQAYQYSDCQLNLGVRW